MIVSFITDSKLRPTLAIQLWEFLAEKERGPDDPIAIVKPAQNCGHKNDRPRFCSIFYRPRCWRMADAPRNGAKSCKRASMRFQFPVAVLERSFLPDEKQRAGRRKAPQFFVRMRPSASSRL